MQLTCNVDGKMKVLWDNGIVSVKVRKSQHRKFCGKFIVAELVLHVLRVYASKYKYLVQC